MFDVSTGMLVVVCTDLCQEIQYILSRAASDQTSLLGDLFDAVKSSKQWTLEERPGDLTTECRTMLVPSGVNEDIS
jgi:hypothetical protein